MVKLLLVFGLMSAVRRATITRTVLPVVAKLKPKKVLIPVKVGVKKVVEKLRKPSPTYVPPTYNPTEPQWFDDEICLPQDQSERCLERRSFT